MVSRFVVVVCGGRHFGDRTALFREMDAIHARRPISKIVEGGATGADRLARLWALAREVRYRTYDAAWDDLSAPGARILTRHDGTRYNANAGFDRNREMLAKERPDRVVAFPGGGGTADMCAVAEAADVEVVRPLEPAPAQVGFGL
jgi:hypothetical protein